MGGKPNSVKFISKILILLIKVSNPIGDILEITYFQSFCHIRQANMLLLALSLGYGWWLTYIFYFILQFQQDLTYKIKSFTRDLHSETQRQIFKKAYDKWSAETNLRIKEDRYANDKDVDIHISFVNGYHSDAYPFDGQGGTLAHAFYPHNNLGK